MFSMIYSEWNMGLWDLQIIAFCFYLHFTKRPNFFGIGLVVLNSTLTITKMDYI